MTRKSRIIVLLSTSAAIITAVTGFALGAAEPIPPGTPKVNHLLFTTSSHCIACHSKVNAPNGEDISIGYLWRASIMANSARDPYWQAGIRRETMEHPTLKGEIEDVCTTCHMPMQRYQAHAEGGKGEAIKYFDAIHNGSTMAEPEMILDEAANPMANLSADGVSCTVCHQIKPDNFGQPSSFTGGFLVDIMKPPEQREVFGPYDMDKGRARIMHSNNGFVPVKGDQIRDARLCAGCHTLITDSFDDKGNPQGKFPEQTPFQEWQHSAYTGTEQTCQSCHMPEVAGKAPITSVHAQDHDGVHRHVFVGGNAFLLRILKDHGKELGVAAQPDELEASAKRSEALLANSTATIDVKNARVNAGRFDFAVTVASKAGHKVPTGYPARRAWLHVTVKDARGNTVFESGAVRPDGSIVGNDNDADATKFEPYYSRITEPDQVQIYEAVLGDYANRVTTGLISTTHYMKDDRLLPRGFDKATADKMVEVVGEAARDPNFTGGTATTAYSVAVPAANGPYTVDAELLYESIGFRWAQNLRNYNAPEPNRFLGYWNEQANQAAKPIARTTATGG